MSKSILFSDNDEFPGIVFQYRQTARSYVFEFVSDNVEDYFGLTPRQIYQDPHCWFDIIFADDQTDFQESLENAGSKLDNWNWKGRILRRDGSLAVFRWTARPAAIDEGIRWRGFVLEFMDNDRLGEGLVRSEEKYRKLFNEALDMIHVVDTTGKILEANRVELEKLGYTAEEYVGKHLRDIIHPDYWERARPQIQKVMSGETVQNVETVLVGKNGNLIPVEVSAQPFMEKGRVVATRAMMRDISQRKQTELELKDYRKQLERLVEQRTGELHTKHEQFNILLDYAADSIIIHDSQGKIIDCNKHACVELGYEYSEMLQMSLFDFEVGVGPRQILPVLKDFVPGKEASYEGVHETKSKLRFPVDVRTTAFVTGGELSFISIARNITEQKRIERKMIEAKEGAEQANREKSVFLSRMSHELRTPLNAIIGFGQLLEADAKEGLLNASQKDNISEILKAAEHLLDLVTDVLDLSNIEAGNIKLNVEVCNIQEVIAESNSVIRHIALEKGVQVQIRDETKASTYVLADHVRIRQVFINLLSNGVKYNKQGGSLVITISLSEDESQVIICVSDTGMGMTLEQQEKLFVPFDRLGRESSDIEGTGIGLNISQLLIEAMGGYLQVNSRPGKGSEFTLRLLRHSGSVEVEEKQAAPSSFPVGGMTAKKILYIEDNLANLKLVSTLFNGLSEYELITATDPKHGIELVHKHFPALILLDINLPVMSGIDVVKYLKKNELTQDIPVVAVSANAMQDDIDIALASGFDDYLTKPVSIDRLLSVVEQHLKGEASIH